MGFLTPYLLWGAAAAGIPIALHLFFRSRYRTVPWAAMSFLLASIEQTSRRLRFQELLLLIVRIVLLAALALALARPTAASPGEILLVLALLFWNVLYIGVRLTHPVVSAKADATLWGGVNVVLLAAFLLVYPWSAAPASGQGANVDAVFLFDISGSMAASDGEMSRFDRARVAAKHIVEQLPPHSTVRILTCADRVVDRFDEPLPLDRAPQAIDELRLTHLATDMAPGVQEAADALARCRAANKELYVFSDMQELGWSMQPAAVAEGFRRVRELAPIHLVRCGTRRLRNVAVLDFTPQTDLPRPGERVAFNIRLRNSSSDSVKDMEIAIAVDGKESELQALPQLDPGETRTITVSARLEKAGLHVVTAMLKHDDLHVDNRLDRVVLVRDKLNVLVVDGGPNTPRPYKASSYYLMHALVLLRDGEQAKYQPQVVVPARAAPELLKNQDLCILVNVPLRPDVENLQKAAVFIAQLLRDQSDLRARAAALPAEKLPDPGIEQHGLAQRADRAVKESVTRPFGRELRAVSQVMAKAAQDLQNRKNATASLNEAIARLTETRQRAERQVDETKRRLFDLARQNRLANTLAPEFVEALVPFVRQGHGLAIFPGDYVVGEVPPRKPGQPLQVDPREGPLADYNDQLWRTHGLLPARLLGVVDHPPPDSPLRFNRDSLMLPALRKFKEDHYYKDASKVEVYRALDVEDPPRPALAGIGEDDIGTVAMRFSRDHKSVTTDPPANGKPALLLRKLGAGQVMLFATSADLGSKLGSLDPTWTDWPLDRSYVPFLDIALSQLVRGQTEVHGVTCGQAFTWYPRENDSRSYTLVHPDGTEERLGVPQPEPGSGRPSVTAKLLSRAGVYRLIAAPTSPETGLPESIPIVAAPDLRETENLDSLTDAQIDERLGFRPIHRTAGNAVVHLERDNREWTSWLLVVVLLLVLGETVLAWWCGRAW